MSTRSTSTLVFHAAGWGRSTNAGSELLTALGITRWVEAIEICLDGLIGYAAMFGILTERIEVGIRSPVPLVFPHNLSEPRVLVEDRFEFRFEWH